MYFPKCNVRFLIFAVIEGLFLQVLATYYIEMSLPEPSSRRHKIRLYECRNNAAQTGTVQCKNIHLWVKKKWIYYHANFYITYGALPQLQKLKRIHLSDRDSNVKLPELAWIGFRPDAMDGPGLDGEPPYAYNYFWEQTKQWGPNLLHPSKRVGLTRFLAAPDMSQLLPRSEPTQATLGVYLDVLQKLMRTYGDRIIKKDSLSPLQPVNRAPSIGDYSENKALEKEIKQAIPVMASKLLDPCLLGATVNPAEGAELDVVELCKTYCSFLRLITKLYKKSNSRLCSNLGDGGVCDAQVCKCNQYFTIKIPFVKQKKFLHRVPMFYCSNVFRLRYEEPALRPGA